MQSKQDIESQLDYIRYNIPEPALLEQLAEEASELAQAALKLARVIRKDNPTPVGYSDARQELVNEYTDVTVAARAYNLSLDPNYADYKISRWISRI